LPLDIKENLIAQGLVVRSPDIHDREGWVVMKVGPRPDVRIILRVLHTAYKHVSSSL